MDTIDNGYKTEENLIITDSVKSFMLETTRWAKFLSIIGFIGIGLMLIGAIFIIGVGSQFRGGSQIGILAVVYFAMAVLYFFPILYLYRFSVNVRDGLLRLGQGEFDAGMENLKSMFKFMGILMIVLLSFYILALVFGLIIGAASM